MTIKNRPESELDRIKKAWRMSDDGILMWVNGFRAGNPVGIQTLKSGHQNCYLFVDGVLKGYSLGQVAWFLHNNEWPLQEIDHIDGNPQNNTAQNLRLATRSEQCKNRISGRNGRANKGVYKRNYGDKWSAQIWVDGICKNLGTYDSEEEAVEVRQLATEMMHGSFANTKSYKKGVQT